VDVGIALLALVLLMIAAYRGFSVIVCAPLAAMLAVALTEPAWVPPLFSGVFMEKLVGFLKLYFPVFLLGAVFGKLIELSGFARSLVAAVIGVLGPRHAMLAIVAVCALLTYGGVSLFVVAFAVYPFAAELFRAADIPKRLIPGTIALGAFTFTMDALPGTPQIQNIIPTTFFGTTTWAAPRLGLLGAAFVLALGMAYLERRRRAAAQAGEGYGEGHRLEPEAPSTAALPHPLLAATPLLLVFGLNRWLTGIIPGAYGKAYDLAPLGVAKVEALDVGKLTAVWAVEGALLVGIASVLLLAARPVVGGLAAGLQAAVGGAMLAALNTASEYGFGGVVAVLPGFKAVNAGLGQAFSDPLLNEAVTTTTLAGITGSASGGMSIALAAMAPTYLQQAAAQGIPAEVLHRVASMASGGMDTLPHNGAVITLLAVTGLTHRESYRDIFAMTLIKTLAVFVAIAAYRLFGLV
jgi:H+/gluconate symporter-like permease